MQGTGYIYIVRPCPVIPATLAYDDDTPRSLIYDDVYFSHSDDHGIAESTYVYLNGNNLAARFAATRGKFCVAELGFGSGLNVLLTMQLWDRYAPPDAELHIISIEKHPLTFHDLRVVQAKFTGLVSQAELLQKHYPLPVCGIHDCRISPTIHLSLIVGDAADALPQIANNSVNAWFLDGFAPAKNPSMWEASLLTHIGRSTKADGSFATFTAAGQVKRDLQQAGFTVTKSPGFGRKRDMLVGCKTLTPCPDIAISYKRPDVIVIGAGIAGASVAYECALRGCKVRVLEQHNAPALEASSNRCAILYPLLCHEWNDTTLFYLRAYTHILQRLRMLEPSGYALCGMRQTSKKPQDIKALKRLQQLPDMLQLDASIVAWDEVHHMLYFPQSGYVDLQQLSHTMLHDANIEVNYNTRVNSLMHNGEWHIHTASETLKGSHVVIANAYDAARLLPQHYLPMHPIRGQVTLLPERDVRMPPSVITCYNGYITPAINGFHHIGATFDKINADLTVTSNDHLANINRLRAHYPEMLNESIDVDTLQGWVAQRIVSADRLPIVGPLYDADMFNLECKNHVYDSYKASKARETILPDIYLSLAHGSRGSLSALYSAALIASDIANDTVQLTDTVATMLHSSRFAVRTWRNATKIKKI